MYEKAECSLYFNINMYAFYIFIIYYINVFYGTIMCFISFSVIHGIQKGFCNFANHTSIRDILAHSIHCKLKNIT